MTDEKKAEKKGYTFTDRRGLGDGPESEDTAPQEPASRQDTGPIPSEPPSGRGTQLSIDFTTLIMSFASAAMFSMGRVPDPATGAVHKDLLIAQQNIEIIMLLHEKTRGNLTADEEKLMDQVLYELKMSYLAAVKEGK